MTSASAKSAAVITGVTGGIGEALGRQFRAAGYFVVGIDRVEAENPACDRFLSADLAEVGLKEGAAQQLCSKIREAVEDRPLSVLLNNAAVQRLGSVSDLQWDDWQETLHVNLSAPLALVRGLAGDLRKNRGVVVNMGSVHATATKPEFVSYATSKAALHGLTRSLAVDMGPEVRVVAIAPAAVETAMLKAGFEGRPDAFSALEGVHPVGRIAQPDEVAKAAVFLASPDAAFMSGSVLHLDGGILSRLHDPL